MSDQSTQRRTIRLHLAVIALVTVVILAGFVLMAFGAWSADQAKIACVENGGEVRSALGSRWDCRLPDSAPKQPLPEESGESP